MAFAFVHFLASLATVARNELTAVVRKQTPDVVARVKDELTTLMGDRMGDGGIRMAAACWIVSAS